ncbi:3-deoxy-D-manno-octulosonic acid transferase [Shimia sp.]|uniref:3-deoxy-D-manno-octulosonic acid transferase n=1 Tax=Shimia sp. TaxID=1954381 RepID=UPI003B8B8852
MQLRSYLMLRPLLQPLMRLIVARRVRQGKEDPERCGEKFGRATLARPEGRLIWLHAVGLGEVLALRPLLAELAQQAPEMSFLVTSTARSSAQVVGANLPGNAVHQFLPLDGPVFVRRFLDHWQPDLAVWSEQDLWPGAICDVAKRGTPLAYINARLSEDGMARRRRFQSGFTALMSRFDRIYAQDPQTARRLSDLGVPTPEVMGSLKPAALPLSVDDAELEQLRHALLGRRVWVAASTHAKDEAVVLEAHQEILARDPEALLIIAPRAPDRVGVVVEAVKARNLTYIVRSEGGMPKPQHMVFVADSFGELGLWYRLAQSAFVGGSFDGVGGHNPWEALCLGCPVLHGPITHNFAQDYLDLDAAGLARCISSGPQSAQVLAAAVSEGVPVQVTEKAASLVSAARARLTPLAADLLSLMSRRP